MIKELNVSVPHVSDSRHNYPLSRAGTQCYMLKELHVSVRPNEVTADRIIRLDLSRGTQCCDKRTERFCSARILIADRTIRLDSFCHEEHSNAMIRELNVSVRVSFIPFVASSFSLFYFLVFTNKPTFALKTAKECIFLCVLYT